jgi:Xaa-Pro aminopeptidase
MTVRLRLASLRHRMKQRGLAAYLIPSTDPHLSEYVPERWERRKYMSGFSGSAGELIVTQKSAGLWTDGRYFLQAAEELAGSGISLMRSGEPGVPSIEEWLAKNLQRGRAVGCDPRLLSAARAERLEKAVGEVGASLRLIDENLVDLGWPEQPSFPAAPAEFLAQRFAGEGSGSKLRKIRTEMRQRGADMLIVAGLDSLAWLFNIRGNDVPYNPVVIGYAYVTQKDVQLFIPPGKIPTQLRSRLGSDVHVQAYDRFGPTLRKRSNPNVTAWIDPGDANRWLLDNLSGCRIMQERSPIALRKARKNAAEIDGMRACHVRDGVAMVRFFIWLEQALKEGTVTEIAAADQLEKFRSEGDLYRGLSFRTISAYGEHGAIIHYGPTPESDTTLQRKGLYLIDSGAQYLDGTTDITRTILLGGKASVKQKEHFTRVLKGHIGLARAKFPEGVRGMRLDTLARVPMWEAGLDYNHGTGHGVGSYLNVHEGPQSISPGRCTGAELEPGNVQSNEPGFYLPGKYGIRIENLILVVQDKKLSRTGESFLAFETLTLCPIDKKLIDKRLLTKEERTWFDDYHARVYRKLASKLKKDEKVWLKRACARL